MQSKLHSVTEVTVNLIGGLLFSIFIVQPLVFWYYDIHLDLVTNTSIAIIFTAVSFIRSYIVRRIFNKITIKAYNDTKVVME